MKELAERLNQIGGGIIALGEFLQEANTEDLELLGAFCNQWADNDETDGDGAHLAAAAKVVLARRGYEAAAS